MELERENKILKVLIVILLVFLVAFGGNYFYEKVVLVNKSSENDNKENINSNNDKNDTNNTLNNNDKINDNSESNLLDLLKGYWVNCDYNGEEKKCNNGVGTSIYIDDDYISIVKLSSDGFLTSDKIISITKDDNNIYSIDYKLPSCSDSVVMNCSRDSYTGEYIVNIDTTHLDDKYILVNVKSVDYNSYFWEDKVIFNFVGYTNDDFKDYVY